MTNPAPSAESLRRARELGRKEAEAFVLRLESLEDREREVRLAEMAWRPSRGPDEPWSDEEASAEVLRLEARVEELSSYVRSVENSAPWRVIQWARRLLGRAW